jgi:hypothetical protein
MSDEGVNAIGPNDSNDNWNYEERQQSETQENNKYLKKDDVNISVTPDIGSAAAEHQEKGPTIFVRDLSSDVTKSTAYI